MSDYYKVVAKRIRSSHPDEFTNIKDVIKLLKRYSKLNDFESFTIEVRSDYELVELAKLKELASKYPKVVKALQDDIEVSE